MAFAEMNHEVAPAEFLKNAVGDLSGIEIFHNQVLIAVYQRPEKTKSGILLAHSTRDEDRYQSKIGLVLKKGPQAFVSGGDYVFETPLDIGDWAIYQPSSGWSVTVNGVLCRILVDTSVKGRVSHPDMIW